MKNLVLAMLAVIFMAGTVLANGEVNAGLGLALGGTVKADRSMSAGLGPPESNSESAQIGGISLYGEYLYLINDIIKVGGGLQYLIEREVADVLDVESSKFSYLPIYLTVQVNPINAAKEIFLKGNIGYNLLFTDSIVKGYGPGVDRDEKGGLYYGISAGYEFLFGLVASVSYDVYSSETKYSIGGNYDKFEYTYSIIGLNVGYKFKI